MRIWVDIEDLQGNRLGAGPILTATKWEHTRRLDRAGVWNFEMPATDPRSAMVRIGRRARCWCADGGQVREVGAGLIELCELRLGETGELMLVVSGDDLLRELANRTVGEIALYDTVRRHPCIVAQWNPPSAWGTDLLECYDILVGDTSTSVAVEMGLASPFLVVADALPFRAVHFVFGSANMKADTLIAEYYNATTGAWVALSITDETALDGKPFCIEGDVAWTIPADWGVRETDGIVLYEVRFHCTTGMDTTDIADVSILRDEPCDDALGRTMAVVAGEWSLDTVMGYDSIGRARGVSGPTFIRNAFVSFDGAADDDISDAYFYWTNVAVDDPNGDRVEATATIYAAGHVFPDGHALKVTHTTITEKVGVGTYQDSATLLQESTDYVLRFWTRGDGSAQGRYRVEALGHADRQYLTPLAYTGVSGTDWAEVECTFTTPVGVTAIRLWLYGPDAQGLTAGTAYFDIVNLQARMGGEVYLRCAGESVLETLVRVSEATGEHFILSPTGRQVAWLRDDVRNLNVQAMAAGGIAVESNDDLVLINDLSEAQDRYELATRVYPFGTGQGSGRVTLRYATRSLPAGWTLNTVENYICYQTAEAALGRVDRVLEWPDISQVGNGPEACRYAANSLADRAYSWLVRHTATNTDRIDGDVPRFYTLNVIKCRRMIIPGFKLRLVYRRVVAGYMAANINVDVWVLGVKTKIDSGGLQVTGLDVATVDAYPTLDDVLIAEEFRRVRQTWRYGA